MNKEVFKNQSENLELTEKEKFDVENALDIMEKVSKAELEFAGNVIQQLKIKTIHTTMGKEWEMKYPSLEEIKKLHALDKIFEITKH
jgi:3-dehydroquinate dehydratase